MEASVAQRVCLVLVVGVVLVLVLLVLLVLLQTLHRDWKLRTHHATLE